MYFGIAAVVIGIIFWCYHQKSQTPWSDYDVMIEDCADKTGQLFIIQTDSTLEVFLRSETTNLIKLKDELYMGDTRVPLTFFEKGVTFFQGSFYRVGDGTFFSQFSDDGNRCIPSKLLKHVKAEYDREASTAVDSLSSGPLEVT